LLVAAFLISGCGQWAAYEARDAARGAAARGDGAGLAQLIEENPSLRGGESAALLLGTAGCSPEMVELMVDRLDVDPLATDKWGTGVVNIMLEPSGEPLPEDFDARGYRSPCDEPDAKLRSLTVVLEAGASPCLVPDGDSTRRPLVAAERWKWEPAVSEMLSQHADDC
jgi:hypothetical protein